MLVLGIDTATRFGSVGLVRVSVDAGTRAAEPGRVTDGCVVVAEVTRETGLAHAGEILTLIDECLAAAEADLAEVGCIAVSAGPGSFTGLRVALATAKGLAFAGAVPIVGVATLEALAATVVPHWIVAEAVPPTSTTGSIVCCLDARKGELYSASFAVREPVWQDANPRLRRGTADAARSPSELQAELRTVSSGEGQLVVLGDGAERYRSELVDALDARIVALPFAEFHPRGAIVARLGAGLLSASGSDDLASLVPSYARASEAEILRERRREG